MLQAGLDLGGGSLPPQAVSSSAVSASAAGKTTKPTRSGCLSTEIDSPAVQKGSQADKRDGPCRDRTCDLGIKSPLLYQLS